MPSPCGGPRPFGGLCDRLIHGVARETLAGVQPAHHFVGVVVTRKQRRRRAQRTAGGNGLVAEGGFEHPTKLQESGTGCNTGR